MPSPIGHALAGIAVVLAADPQAAAGGVRRFLSRPVTLGCVALATLPDADLLVRGFHRTATHSLGGTIAVIIVAMAVTGWVTRQRTRAIGERTRARKHENTPNESTLRKHESTPRKHESTKGNHVFRWGVVWVLAAAQASHLLTDWLGTDLSNPAGIQVLWPFSDHWFISGWDLFPRLERRDMLSPTSMAINFRALVWEVVLLGPIVSVLWWLRDRARSTEGAQRPQKTM